jgi:hypothetical protein
MALSSLLEEALKAWQYTRDGVIEELENLSETDLKFRRMPRAELFRVWRKRQSLTT